MKSENIVAVIEKLGEVIINNNFSISYLEYENEKLKNQIEEIEQYINYYAEQELTSDDYRTATKNNKDVSKSQ